MERINQQCRRRSRRAEESREEAREEGQEEGSRTIKPLSDDPINNDVFLKNSKT